MRIGFSGHRSVTCSDSALAEIAKEFPDAVWYNGGAGGFDTQVTDYSMEFRQNSKLHTIRPLYDKEPVGWGPGNSPWNKIAPLERNKVIVKLCDLLIACWDGRETGGTYFTIMYAFKKHKKVAFVRPVGKIAINDIDVGRAMSKARDWNGDSGVPEPTPERFPCLNVADRCNNEQRSVSTRRLRGPD